MPKGQGTSTCREADQQNLGLHLQQHWKLQYYGFLDTPTRPYTYYNL